MPSVDSVGPDWALPKSRNVVLVGLMGAGKTTVGRLLARRLGWQFADSDHEIERRTGVRIPVIFDIEGEDGFRKREAAVIAELLEMDRLVLATGGGIVLRPENREQIKSRAGLVCYIRVSPELLHARTRHDKGRPLLQVDDPLAKIKSLLMERESLYREVSGIEIDGDCHSARQIAAMVEKEVVSRCDALT